VRDRFKHTSDTALAKLAQEGDNAAFEEIYDRHAEGVARTVATFAGPDRDAVDDLVQDVFYRVIDRITSYVPSHPFAHWLYTIALNVGRNYARQRSKVVTINPDEFDGLSLDDGHSDDLADGFEEAVLFRLVSRLPDRMHEVLSLRIGSQMSYGEIAETLGIPEGTARSRMHHALVLLRDKMGITDNKENQNE
jgi:RNA polymerase sigma-70 factor (ECF subfamily)